MRELSFSIRGKRVTVAAAGLQDVDYGEAVDAARKVSSGEKWVTVTRPDALVANPRHLLTAALYAASSYMGGSMISRYPEMELLLYLLGTRNIRSVLREMEAEESIGVAAVSIGGSASQLLEGYASMLGARRYAPSLEGWAKWYRGYLERRGIRSARRMSKDAILALLRARAALVRLSV